MVVVCRAIPGLFISLALAFDDYLHKHGSTAPPPTSSSMPHRRHSGACLDEEGAMADEEQGLLLGRAGGEGLGEAVLSLQHRGGGSSSSAGGGNRQQQMAAAAADSLTGQGEDEGERKEEEGQQQGGGGLGYFHVALVGYVSGMVMSLACASSFRTAQPALLYLVPCVLGPIATKALRAPGGRHLSMLWHGFDDQHDDHEAMRGMEEAAGKGGGLLLTSGALQQQRKESIC